MMDDGAKARAVYRLVKAALNRTIEDEIEAKSKLAAAVEGDALWKQNEENIGMHRSPYSVDQAKARVDKVVSIRAEWEEVMEYTVNKFFDGVKP